MRACKFVTADGLQLEIEGNVADATKSPRGSLQWVFGAPSKEAYATLVQLFDLPEGARAAGRKPSRPSRPCASPAPYGSASASRARPTSPPTAACRAPAGSLLTALLDGGLGNWRNAPADITATIDSPDVPPVVNGLGARTVRCTDARHGAAGGRDLPQGGRHAGERHDDVGRRPRRRRCSSATTAAWSCRTTAVAALDGELRVSARGVSDVMAVAGLGSGAALERNAHRRHHQARIRQSRHRIEAAAADHRRQPRSTAASRFPIRARDRPSSPGRSTSTAATVQGLLGLALDRKQVAEAPGAEPLTAGKTIWPEHAFDFCRPRRHRGQAQRRLRHADR